MSILNVQRRRRSSLAAAIFIATAVRAFSADTSRIRVVAMSVGSLGNPLGFLALAIKPNLPQRPTSVFGAIMVSCFVLTTLGYGGAAWTVARAVVLGAK